MTHDDETVERIARLIYDADALRPRLTWERLTPLTQGEYRKEARAALSAMPQRLSPELIAKLTALASRLTAQGEYEAVDLIDTVVARATAMPERELLREALEALDRVLLDVEFMWEDGTLPDRRDDVIYVRARAAADKIRASLTQEPQP